MDAGRRHDRSEFVDGCGVAGADCAGLNILTTNDNRRVDIWQRSWWLIAGDSVLPACWRGSSTLCASRIRRAPWATWSSICARMPLTLCWPAICPSMMSSRSGKIVSRVTSDTQDFANVVTLTLNLMSQVLLVVIIFGILFYIDVRLALIAAGDCALDRHHRAGFPPSGAHHHADTHGACSAQVNANVQESLDRASPSPRISAKSRRSTTSSARSTSSPIGINLRTGLRLQLRSSRSSAPSRASARCWWSTLAGERVGRGASRQGTWFLFVESINLFWFPLTGIASFWSQFQLGLSASERVFALVDAEPRSCRPTSSRCRRWRGRIEFRARSTFAIPSKSTVLDDFNLTIAAGRDGGVGRAHGRGQVEPGQAGCALL